MSIPIQERKYVENDREASFDFKTGLYYPSGIITNQEIESWKIKTQSGRLVLSSDIDKRTGIQQRFIASPDETAYKMGAYAVEIAQGNSKSADLILVSTSYPKGHNFAQALRHDFHFQTENFFDFHAACSGFPYMLSFVKKNEKQLEGANILFLATEKYSDTVVDLKTRGADMDPSLAQTIFSDGSVALGGIYKKDFEVLSYVNRLFPAQISQCLKMPIDELLMKQPFFHIPVPKSESGMFEQNGPQVYNAVIRTIPDLVNRAIEHAGLDQKDIKLIIPHQGSSHILNGLSRKLTDYDLAYDITDGNFSSASIPKALIPVIKGETIEVIKNGEIITKNPGLKKGDIIVLAGFGAGLFASIVVLRL